MKKINIPYFNIKGECNAKTIKKAIEILNNKYLIDWCYMEDKDRIELLEISASLTNILFKMEEINK